MKFLSIKYHTLLNYLTNISFYFFLKSSGTRSLQIHPVIDALVDLRTTLDKLETLESKMEDIIKQFIDRLETDVHIDKNEKAEKGSFKKNFIYLLINVKRINSFNIRKNRS
jgi:U3 small nucleolar RNA-associated protein 3